MLMSFIFVISCNYVDVICIPLIVNRSINMINRYTFPAKCSEVPDIKDGSLTSF